MMVSPMVDVPLAEDLLDVLTYAVEIQILKENIESESQCFEKIPLKITVFCMCNYMFLCALNSCSSSIKTHLHPKTKSSLMRHE